MPGSKESLPAIPSFAAVAKAEPQPEAHQAPVEPQAVAKEPQVVEKASEKPAPAEAVAKPVREREDDPFRDDPVSEGEQK
jgi:hypothetical protein